MTQIEKAATEEIWLPVKGYEGLYEVSDQGQVRSVVRLGNYRPHVLKPARNRYGYLRVALCKNSKSKMLYVHRLVAQAFCPNPCPDKFIEVNHRDEDKANNRSDNLEWCDSQYNNNYGTHIDRVAKANTNNQKISKQVQQFDLNGNLLATYPSLSEAERVTRISNGNICNCCNGKYKSSGGYVWRYKEV